MNEFFPCRAVEHSDGSYAAITSDFHYFDAYFKNGCGGYDLQSLAKSLAKKHDIKGLKYDCEAGMFCVYSKDLGALKALCERLREISGQQSDYAPVRPQKPKIKPKMLDELLLKGFVLRLDEDTQKRFLDGVPLELSPLFENYAAALAGDDEKAQFEALRRINSQACSQNKRRDCVSALGHPAFLRILFDFIDKNPSDKPHLEALRALEAICMRHLPDLRAAKYFIAALAHKKADFRQVGICGLGTLYEYDLKFIEQLTKDKSAKVANAAARTLKFGFKKKDSSEHYIFPVWMFSGKLVRRCEREIFGR